MILTPVDHRHLADTLPAFRWALGGLPTPTGALAIAVLDRIVQQVPQGDLMQLSTDEDHHRAGIQLCRDFQLGVLDDTPQNGFTWNGSRVAVQMEPSVVIHEVAHYQCAAPYRRALPDFGLGAGPETGAGKAGADALCMVRSPESDVEEGLSSLLGILWEAELGQPAILAFLEQNWLEGGADPRSVNHFAKTVTMLFDTGLIDSDGRPTRGLRAECDALFFDRWFRT